MSGRRIVIVGGGPAGLAAARAYRAAGGRGSVTIVAGHEPAAPPVRTQIVRGWAAALDVDGYCVRLDDGRTLEYDGCVLATGAAREPARAGAHRIEDVRAVPDGAAVTVVGTDLEGCQTAATLAQRGVAVTLTGTEPVPGLERLGPEAGERIATWLVDLGVELRLGVEPDPSGDVVLEATRARPRVELAAGAGLRLSEDGDAIAADECLRTTGDGVYAAGDACDAVHPVAGRPLRINALDDALVQGAIAGRRLAGDLEARWETVPGQRSTIGDRSLAYAAWGDGFAADRLVDHEGDGWTVWYTDAQGACVGVLAHDRDADYERGKELIAAGAVPS